MHGRARQADNKQMKSAPMRDRVNESFVRIVFSVPLAEMSSAMDMLYCNQVTAVTILRCFYRGIIRVIHFFPIVYARLTVSRLKFADSTTRCRSWLNRRILAARRSNERKQREKMDYPYSIANTLVSRGTNPRCSLDGTALW